MPLALSRGFSQLKNENFVCYVVPIRGLAHFQIFTSKGLESLGLNSSFFWVGSFGPASLTPVLVSVLLERRIWL